MTNAELQSICNSLSISYSETDVKMKLVALIAKNKNLEYSADNLTGKTLNNLKAICDGLGITYDDSADEEALKALILA